MALPESPHAAFSLELLRYVWDFYTNETISSHVYRLHSLPVLRFSSAVGILERSLVFVLVYSSVQLCSQVRLVACLLLEFKPPSPIIHWGVGGIIITDPVFQCLMLICIDRFLFIIEGAATVFFACLTAFVIPDWPATTKWLSEEEKALGVIRLIEDAGEEETEIKTMDAFKMAAKDYRVWLCILGQVRRQVIQNKVPN